MKDVFTKQDILLEPSGVRCSECRAQAVHARLMQKCQRLPERTADKSERKNGRERNNPCAPTDTMTCFVQNGAPTRVVPHATCEQTEKKETGSGPRQRRCFLPCCGPRVGLVCRGSLSARELATAAATSSSAGNWARCSTGERGRLVRLDPLRIEAALIRVLPRPLPLGAFEGLTLAAPAAEL